MDPITEQSKPQGQWRERPAGTGEPSFAARRRGMREKERQLSNGVERRARGLGWFSIGLGIAQLAAAGGLSSFALGAARDRRRRTMRLVGARQLACGLGILARPGASGWLWMRVAGDLIDLTLLGRSLTARRTDKGRVLRSMAGVLEVTALDTVTSVQLSRQARTFPRGARRFAKAVTVNRPTEEVYRFWRNLQNLPRFMAHLESVQVLDDRRSHWTARGPAESRFEWDAEITEDRPNERISWRSIEGSQVDNAGTVSFRPAPAGRGTEILLELAYKPPGGLFGVSLAKLLGEEPGQKAAGDLRRFKQVIETGEVLQSDASSRRGRQPARPSEQRPLSSDGGGR